MRLSGCRLAEENFLMKTLDRVFHKLICCDFADYFSPRGV
jgi:hypothetical protein